MSIEDLQNEKQCLALQLFRYFKILNEFLFDTVISKRSVDSLIKNLWVQQHITLSTMDTIGERQ